MFDRLRWRASLVRPAETCRRDAPGDFPDLSLATHPEERVRPESWWGGFAAQTFLCCES
jgi:hypothetical protein